MSRVLFIDASAKGSVLASASNLSGKWSWECTFSRPEAAGTVDFLDKSYALAVNHGSEPFSGILVGAGPGSFTGIKIGLAFAYGIATALTIPMAGISILEIACREYARKNASTKTLFVSKATRQAGYFCLGSTTDQAIHGKVRLKAGAIEFVQEGSATATDLLSQPPIVIGEWPEFMAAVGPGSQSAIPIGHFDAESLALDGILAWLASAWPLNFRTSRAEPRYLREPAPVET